MALFQRDAISPQELTGAPATAERFSPNQAYLFRWFEWDTANIKADHGTGTTMIHVTKGDMEQRPVPLPPLAEQRRIVAKLDTLTGRLTRARTELDRVATMATKARGAVLSAFIGRMSRYPKVTLGQLVTTIFDGPFGSNLKSADYTSAGARVVRLENIGRLRFLGDKKTFVSLEKFSNLTRYMLQPDDVLFSSFVDQEVRVCLFPSTITEPTINKADCFAIRVDRSLCNPRLLAFVLGAPETFKAIKAHVHGDTRPRVNIGILKRFELNLPPPEQQSKMADEVELAFTRADRLEAEAARARALLDRLQAAILAKAFRGELVSQDSADEPASLLLDRIRTQLAAAPAAKRSRRAIPARV